MARGDSGGGVGVDGGGDDDGGPPRAGQAGSPSPLTGPEVEEKKLKQRAASRY